jgi:pyruvate/2-oxoglutarate dehydrogenase complex dihydrolipoamide dehydrogenase (E3) component
MEAARVAAEKGHDVTLFEKTDQLAGGQVRLAGAAPGKDEFLNLVGYYKGQFEKQKNLKLVLGKYVFLDDIEREGPDTVILATGATPAVPDIEGIDSKHVATIAQVMGGEVKVQGKVVIAGGGCAGIDCANFLSSQGIDVTVLEMTDACAMDEELITRLTLLHTLGERQNLKLLTHHTIQRIVPGGVVATDKEGNEVTISAGYVVTAMGFVSHNPLEKGAKRQFKKCLVVGDARQPGKIMEAVADGFFAGQST